MIKSILLWLYTKLGRWLDPQLDKKIEEKDKELKELRELQTSSNILIAVLKNDYQAARLSLQEKDKALQRLSEDKNRAMEAMNELQKKLESKSDNELVDDAVFPSSNKSPGTS